MEHYEGLLEKQWTEREVLTSLVLALALTRCKVALAAAISSLVDEKHQLANDRGS